MKSWPRRPSCGTPKAVSMGRISPSCPAMWRTIIFFASRWCPPGPLWTRTCCTPPLRTTWYWGRTGGSISAAHWTIIPARTWWRTGKSSARPGIWRWWTGMSMTGADFWCLPSRPTRILCTRSICPASPFLPTGATLKRWRSGWL